MKIIDFRYTPSTASNIYLSLICLTENLSSIELTPVLSSMLGTGIEGSRFGYAVLPDEVTNKPGHNIWSLEISSDGIVVDTVIVEINNTKSSKTIRAERTAVKAEIELYLARALFDGKTKSVSSTETHILSEDGTVLQKIYVVDGERDSEFSGYLLSWTGVEATLQTTAILSVDAYGNQTWFKELTQMKEL